MSFVYVLFGILIVLIAFAVGYNLAIHNESVAFQKLGEESDYLEPIFARLDREYKYTDKLTKPFTDDE